MSFVKSAMKKLEQMFLGQYYYSLDEKSRLTVPACYRDLLSDGAFVTQGFDCNILVLTTGAFQEIYKCVMAMNIADPLVRLLIRMLLGNASQLEMDESGSIIVPQKLRELADLKDEAVIVGQGDYFEIWAPLLWNRQEIRLQDAEANAQRLAVLDLTRH
jgi:MraZ protein